MNPSDLLNYLDYLILFKYIFSYFILLTKSWDNKQIFFFEVKEYITHNYFERIS